MKTIASLIISLILCITTSSQSIRINEFSQGASGAKEWVELVVSSATPITYSNCVMAKVNIAGWILDDNNGDFSPLNHFTGTGMATGHMRFKNEAPWNNLPIGAIIVIYNALDKDLILPADDPYDWVNNDCVYIVPSNHVSLEYCTTLPIASSCILRTDYTACTYVSTGTWANVGLANAGDAIQIRNPSFGLVHGLVYGRATSASGCTTTDPMVGNILAPVVSSTSMSVTAASFIGTTDADYFDATKWVLIAAGSATPGTPNNATNENYITNTLRGGCTCNRVLPLDDGTLGNQYYFNNSFTEITLINDQLTVNFKGREKHRFDVIVYDNLGRITNYSRFNQTSNKNKVTVSTKSGVNYIRVLIYDDLYTNKTIKYLR